MADEGMPEAEIASSLTRWTCEACGCNTNTEQNDTVSCGVCGTRRFPSLLRRGVQRVGLARRFNPDDDDDDDAQDDDDQGDEQNDRNPRLNNDSDSTDAAALLMAGVADASIPFRGSTNMGSSRRILRVGSVANSFNPLLRHEPAPGRGSGRTRRNARFTHGNIGLPSSFPSLEPEELLLHANENSSFFNPKWSTNHKGASIIVDVENHPQVAYLGEGGDEGRCIRAVESLPAQFSSSSNNSEATHNSNESGNGEPINDIESKRRNIYGWKIAFDHPSRDIGKSMGGCYLAGVTTNAFTVFSERNGLQQSQQFWGVEDGGRKYEGSSNRNRQGSNSSSNGIQLGRGEAVRNSDNVLFGSREVITIVADLDARTLTYWRDARFLGTLVTRLPRSSMLYPVVVPFNVGVGVSITAMNGEPISVLSGFHAAQRLAREALNQSRRKALAEQRATLITNGALSNELVVVLRTLFSWYASDASTTKGSSSAYDDLSNIKLNLLSAARLWYRCGLRLSNLRLILETSKSSTSTVEESVESISDDESWRRRYVSSDDFISLISRIVKEDINSDKDNLQLHDTSSNTNNEAIAMHSSPLKSSSDSNPPFEVGDRVEVAEGFEKYGDAVSGPLRPGDRGIVMEVQRGPRGDRQSVRVVFNGRRWWYQPPALISERSGLLPSPSVRLIYNILRAHGYDSSLQPLWGKPLSVSSWMPGDLVISTSLSFREGLLNSCKKSQKSSSFLIGRISKENASSDKETGFVTVDFPSTKVGSKRVDVQSLIYTTFYHGSSICSDIQFCSVDHDQKHSKSECVLSNENDDDKFSSVEEDELELRLSSLTSKIKNVGEKDSESKKKASSSSTSLSKHISGIANIDKESIAFVLKECKSFASLAGMFYIGLPNAILSALDHAQRNDIESSAIKSLGSLIVAVTKQLFTEACDVENNLDGVVNPSNSSDEQNKPASEENSEGNNSLESSRRPMPNFVSNSNSVNVRDLIRDLGVGSEQRRGVLLALMASARMNDESRSFNPSSSNEFHVQRGRHFLSSFGRLNAESPAFEFSSANQNAAENDNLLNPVSADTSNSDSETFLQKVIRGGANHSTLSQKSATTRRSINAVTKILIQDGILSNNIWWVKKALKLGANADTSRDEDGNTMLQLAVIFGCESSIVNTLIKAGATVRVRELQEAAWSNQPTSLSLLLQHAIYREGTIDTSCCAQVILDTLAQASAKQKLQEDAMQNVSEDFSVEVLKKIVVLALRYRHEKKKSHVEWLTDALVGEVLLHTMHLSQIQGKFGKNVDENVMESDFSRVPAFSNPASSSIYPTTLSGVFGSNKGSSKTKLNHKPFSSLLDTLPASVVCAALNSDDVNEVSSTLTSYLRLTETYLWSKDVRDASIGLTLAYTLLKKAPHLCNGMRRYGIQDLASYHIQLADDAISEIDLIGHGEQMKDDALKNSNLNRKHSFVVKCPKHHTTILHLTKHSQFKCDLCGKGVEQNKPMHGCRECDWDACEKCTDKAEGGLVKWTYIRNLAVECQLMLLNRNNDDFPSNFNNDLDNVCEKIRNRTVNGVKDLCNMLNDPGKITLYEFTSLVLPSLHRSLVFGNNEQNFAESCVENNRPLRRRSKKQRIGCLLPRKNNQQMYASASKTNLLKSYFMQGNVDMVGDGSSFVNIALKILLTSRENEQSNRDLIQNEENNVGAISINIVKSNTRQTNDKSREETQGDDESSDNSKEESESLQCTYLQTPAVLRYLHSVLAFHERMVVTRYARRNNTDSGNNGGDLQSLLQPFEIRLKRSATDAESCSDLNQVSVHVEPLMSISELQLHILRCAKINIPSYIQYCHKLAQDRAIIVERSTRNHAGNSIEGKHSVRRIARVVEYNEDTGVHRICYSKQLFPTSNESNTIDDELVFDGTDTLVILAAKDYCILHREQCNTEDGCNFEMDQDHIENLSEIDREGASCMMDMDLNESNLPMPSVKENFMLPTGMRMESVSSLRGNGLYEAYTILSAKYEESSRTSAQNSSSLRYNLVSDVGEVILAVNANKLRGHDIYLKHHQMHFEETEQRERETSDSPINLRNSHQGIFERSVPISSVRRSISSGTQSSDNSDAGRDRHLYTPTVPAVGVLRRTWSALSPIQNMKPLLLKEAKDIETSSKKRTRKYSIGERELEISTDFNLLEKPPILNVGLSANESTPTVTIQNMNDITLFSGLQRLFLHDKQSKHNINFASKRKFLVYYSISIREDVGKTFALDENSCFWPQERPLPKKFIPPWTKMKAEGSQIEMLNASSPSFINASIWNRSLSDFSLSRDGDMECDASMRSLKSNEMLNSIGKGSMSFNQCEGLSDTCVQCLELLGVLSERNLSRTKVFSETNPDKKCNFSSMFVSEALTGKLMAQLEDPLTVVGGALPDWCRIAPCLAPQVFSHSARRRLMEWAAFGVSRSALRQQEAKIAVGPLRQKMAALRGRAVELVGEAFSGGAADPTALQLQADELYGMEDALANRINAAFRAQRWDERSLQCAKAVVRREFLLKDAAGIMDQYASDSRVSRRRLEVRFEGESGFDAASGDEAGVTRGFYADVADALLSCENVAGVFSPALNCVDAIVSEVESSVQSIYQSKLPLWIPDVDASSKVVIPTPRADPGSGLGVYPRPLALNDPMRGPVLECFRFIGRLFAAALRDGFVFPLPLSASFFKLVQSGFIRNIEIGNPVDQTMKKSQKDQEHNQSNSTFSSDFISNASYLSSAPSSPNRQHNLTVDEFFEENENSSGSCSQFIHHGKGTNQDSIQLNQNLKDLRHISSLDLPRPGFLGGEIYAVESYICTALDLLDVMEPNLTEEELAQRRKIIATDKSFARAALGKSYDCSFEEYFIDKTFVDPLDPNQGRGSTPLCQDGAFISVTIDNVREWVNLSKRFFLYDGVISQALAFRQGVNDFFSVNVLRLFTAEELFHDVCGGGDNVDNWDETAIRALFKLDGGEGAAEALVAVVAMGGEGGAALSRRFGPSSPTIGYLVKALLEANTTERRQFLSFVTSVPIVTPGQIEVVPIVNPAGEFLPMMDPGCLPRSNTCARKLYLPKFENFQVFSQVLWSVVQEECRFKGFFEWRG